jgi:hypothetical protein
MGSDSCSDRDGDTLRGLAARLMEIAALPVHDEKAELWRRVNDGEAVRPMVYVNEEPVPELVSECEELRCRCEDPFMMDLIERPEFVDALVSRYVDAKMHELDQMEALGADLLRLL